MSNKIGLALIDGTWRKVPYPFKRTIRLIKKDLKLIDGNVQKLIIREFKLLGQKAEKKIDNKDGYTLYYPKAHYRFNRFITRGEKDD